MRRVWTAIACAILLLTASAGPARAGSICRDGSWTPSEGSGTCSHHGGVAQKGVAAPGSPGGGTTPPDPDPLVAPQPVPIPAPTQPVPLPAPTQPSALTPPAGVRLPKAVTPGAIDPRVTQANLSTTICRSGYTRTVRPSSSYTTRLKREQLASTYADVADKRTGSYEEDHLISLELGGHPTDPANLWPEPYAGSTGARVKDRLENRLNRMVCSGAITLARAQQEIATDWWQAYLRYVG